VRPSGRQAFLPPREAGFDVGPEPFRLAVPRVRREPGLPPSPRSKSGSCANASALLCLARSGLLPRPPSRAANRKQASDPPSAGHRRRKANLPLLRPFAAFLSKQAPTVPAAGTSNRGQAPDHPLRRGLKLEANLEPSSRRTWSHGRTRNPSALRDVSFGANPDPSAAGPSAKANLAL